MEIFQTDEFGNDIKRADKPVKEALRKKIDKISGNPSSGKPMKHNANVFSERIEGFRLIYKIDGKRLILLCFKKRDQVYGYLLKSGF